MKTIFLVLAATLLAAFLTAQAPDWDWAVQGGGAQSDGALDICLDSNGNSYVTGYFAATAYFGPLSLTSVGAWDVVVAKVEPDGDYAWVARGGGANTDYGYSIARDGSGNLYICGTYSASATFGAITLPYSGGTDIFIAKLDPNGNWLWAVNASGTSSESARGITADAAGNCYATGVFAGSATFGPNTLTASADDIWVAKLNSAGGWEWTVQAGGSNTDVARGIGADALGNCYITGYFYDVATFGGIPLTSAGVGDIFVARLDSSGYWQWAVRAGGSYNELACDIATNSDGTSYITGGFLSVNCVFGSHSIFGDAWGYDIFAACLDSAGVFLWAKGTTPWDDMDDIAYGISLGEEGTVCICGDIQDMAYFGDTALDATGDSFQSDAFAAKLDQNGEWLWAVQAGGIFGDTGRGIASLNGTLCVAGGFTSTASFGAHTLTASGSYLEAFVAALEVNSGTGSTVFPATWDFETPTFPPEGCSIVDADGTGTTWVESTDHNTTPDGTKSAVHYASEAGNQDGWLILPAVLMPEDSFMTLSFQHLSEMAENCDYCCLLANSSPDPQDPGWTEIWSANSVYAEWSRVFVDVTAYTGQTMYFAFRYQGGNAANWYLDDISIYEVEPVISLPVAWDFEGTEFPPTGWSTQDYDGQPSYWKMDSEHNHTTGGSNCAVHNYSEAWEGDYGQDGWLITPPIVLPELRNPLVLDFWHYNFWMDYYTYNGVMVRSVSRATTGWEEIWSPASVSEEWRNVTLNIGAYAGQTVQFAFVYRGFNGHDWFVDDVSILELTGADNLPPIISYLPQMSTPRPDVSYTLTAEVVDDPIWQSAIDEVVLHYRAADTYYDLPMDNVYGNTWTATIPPQNLGTRVDYFFTATDVFENNGSTGDWDYFKWFAVDNPVWLFYNWDNAVGLGRPDTFGAANRFANPYHELGLDLLLQQVAIDTPQPVQANLHIYSDDGASLTDLTGPIPVDLNGLNYYYMPANLVINTPYFYVSIEDIPGGNGVWFTSGDDYGMSFWKEAGYFSEVEEQGSWIIHALIANATLAVPEISLSLLDGVPQLTWDPVLYAINYHVFTSADPCADDEDWTLRNVTWDTYYWPEYEEAHMFFRIIADNTQPVKANPAWSPENIVHAKKAIRPERIKAD